MRWRHWTKENDDKTYQTYEENAVLFSIPVTNTAKREKLTT